MDTSGPTVTPASIAGLLAGNSGQSVSQRITPHLSQQLTQNAQEVLAQTVLAHQTSLAQQAPQTVQKTPCPTPQSLPTATSSTSSEDSKPIVVLFDPSSVQSDVNAGQSKHCFE